MLRRYGHSFARYMKLKPFGLIVIPKNHSDIGARFPSLLTRVALGRAGAFKDHNISDTWRLVSENFNWRSTLEFARIGLSTLR